MHCAYFGCSEGKTEIESAENYELITAYYYKESCYFSDLKNIKSVGISLNQIIKLNLKWIIKNIKS